MAKALDTTLLAMRQRLKVFNWSCNLRGEIPMQQQPGLDQRHRDKDGTIARKHGNTLIGTLRRTCGQHFAGEIADTEKLSDVLQRLDDQSLAQLVRGTPDVLH